MKQRIALVDDDENILTSVAMALETEGFEVVTYTDGESGFKGIQKDPVSLVVLDIKMPRMDGIEALRRIREVSQVPVIFLTSKDDEIDQFLGLRLGADDYITKPFSQRLLIERIRAILRREALRAKAQSSAATLAHGNLVLDEERHACFWKDKALDITVTEFLLIKCLALHPGHVKSREQMMNFAYGENTYVDDRTVDSHVKRIRKKFKDVDLAFEGIETVYGLGYRLRDGR